MKTNYTGDKIPIIPPTKSGHTSNLFPWHKSILWWRCFRVFTVPGSTISKKGKKNHMQYLVLNKVSFGNLFRKILLSPKRPNNLFVA
jgi:hypothetical protein